MVAIFSQWSVEPKRAHVWTQLVKSVNLTAPYYVLSVMIVYVEISDENEDLKNL